MRRRDNKPFHQTHVQPYQLVTLAPMVLGRYTERFVPQGKEPLAPARRRYKVHILCPKQSNIQEPVGTGLDSMFEVAGIHTHGTAERVRHVQVFGTMELHLYVLKGHNLWRRRGRIQGRCLARGPDNEKAAPAAPGGNWRN